MRLTKASFGILLAAALFVACNDEKKAESEAPKTDSMTSAPAPESAAAAKPDSTASTDSLTKKAEDTLTTGTKPVKNFP